MRITPLTDDELNTEIRVLIGCIRDLSRDSNLAHMFPPARIESMLLSGRHALAIALELRARRDGREVGAELEPPDLLSIPMPPRRG